MKRTLQAMRLWDDDLKRQFAKEVKEMKESHSKSTERRSRSAKRAARTRAIAAESKVALVITEKKEE